MQIKIFTILLVVIGLIIFGVSAPAEARVLDDAGCTSIGGTCQDASTCLGPTFEPKPGYCPGGENNQCCVRTGTVPADGSEQPIQLRTTFETTNGETIELPNPLGVESFTELIYRIIDFLAFTIGPAAVTLMILIGAFQILMAGGNPEKVTTGRKTITYAVIGFALLLLADGIIYIIVDLLS